MADMQAEAHGGGLVNLMVDEDRAGLLKEITMNLPDVNLSERNMCDLEVLATGGFSPLESRRNGEGRRRRAASFPHGYSPRRSALLPALR